MEIERKWMVNGWPEGSGFPVLPLKEEFAMRQGYISVHPTVRIREEALKSGKTDYILCFKSGGGLASEEIERSIDKELFDELEQKIIGKPLIEKVRRSYLLPDGLVLEVNHVDEGQPTAITRRRSAAIHSALISPLCGQLPPSGKPIVNLPASRTYPARTAWAHGSSGPFRRGAARWSAP